MNTESVERKFKKKVSRNGWQFRLHKWAYNSEPKFKGYCPLFWSCWVIILISPFILFGKFTEFFFSLIFSFFKSPPESGAAEVVKPKVYSQPADEVLDIFFKYFEENKEATIATLESGGGEFRYTHFTNIRHSIQNLCGDFYENSYSIIDDAIGWIEVNPNWKDFVPAAQLRIKAKEDKAKKLAARRAAFQEKKSLIVNYLSYTVKPLLFISSLGLAYFLYLAVFYIVSLVSLNDVILFLKNALIAGPIILGITLGVAGLAKLIAYIKSKLDSIPEPVQPVESKPSLFTVLISGIIEGVSFLIETVKMTYTKECPLIEVTDDKSGPIEKNK